MTNHDAARAATDEAIERVERHADDDWKRLAYRAVRWLASTRAEFTAEDAGDALRRYYPDAQTHEPRAMGPIMKRAQRDGIIEATDHFRRSDRPESHCCPKQIWASLIHDDAAREAC